MKNLDKISVKELFNKLSFPQIISILGIIISMIVGSFMLGYNVHKYSLESAIHTLTVERNNLKQHCDSLTSIKNETKDKYRKDSLSTFSNKNDHQYGNKGINFQSEKTTIDEINYSEGDINK